MNKKDHTYTLTMTQEQALTVSKACEFYARVMMGQFNEIAFETMMPHMSRTDFCERRDYMETLLHQARKCAFPDLTGPGHSYGVGHTVSSDRAWEAYQVLRHAIAWTNKPEGGSTVDFHPPMCFSGDKSMPQVLVDGKEVKCR